MNVVAAAVVVAAEVVVPGADVVGPGDVVAGSAAVVVVVPASASTQSGVTSLHSHSHL